MSGEQTFEQLEGILTSADPLSGWISTSSMRHELSRASDSEVLGQSAETILDGFMLLDACRVEFPDEASNANLSGLNINDIASDDLQYFTNLYSVDMSDNQAPIEPLGNLPCMSELFFQCNALKSISSLEGFERLEVLDLSYNRLKDSAVQELTKLTRLRELYLTDNLIRRVSNMDKFGRLEILSLERNKITQSDVLVSLSVIPHLKRLNISGNKVSCLPEEAVGGDRTGFPELEYLNLAYNKITREKDLMPVVEITTLRYLIIYGNPIAQAAVLPQNVTELAYDPVPSISYDDDDEPRDINIVVAYPEEKGRRWTKSLYKNIEFRKVQSDDIPMVSEFRERGNRMLFTPTGQPLFSGGDYNSIQMERQDVKHSQERVPIDDDTFLTGVGLEEIAPGDEIHAAFASIDLSKYSQNQSVPATLFSRTLAASGKTDRTKLRSALAALRYHLKRPTLPAEDLSETKGFAKATESHKMRRRPRHRYVAEEKQE